MHFLLTASLAICGEASRTISGTKDETKVDCQACKAALAVTTLHKRKEPQPEVKPSDVSPGEVKP